MNAIYVIVAVCSYSDFTIINWEEPVCSVITNNYTTAKRTLSKVRRLWCNWQQKITEENKRFEIEHPKPIKCGEDYDAWLLLYNSKRCDWWNSFTCNMNNEDIHILRRMEKGNYPDEFKIIQLPVCGFKH